MRLPLNLLTKALIAALFCLTLAGAARAAEFIVTTDQDTNDGVCDAHCSLREAIAAASPTVQDRIVFSVFFNAPRTITLSSAPGFGEILIDKSVIITAKGAHLTTIRRDPALNTYHRIFLVTNNAGVILSGMTITNGRTAGGTGFGSAIFASSGTTLHLASSHVTGNQATGDMGLGAVSSFGNLEILNSTIANNSITATMPGAGGGGVCACGPSSSIVNSTISGNAVSGTAFGSDWNGGGILVNGPTTIRNSTITDNFVQGDNSGSGILSGSVLNIGSTIVAGNRSLANLPDVAGNAAVSAGYNLVGNAGSSGGGYTHITDRAGTPSAPVDPVLGAIAINGGQILLPTHMPLAGSPAIDKGYAFGLLTDQRRLTRTVDNLSIPPAMGGDNTDIGATETVQFPSLIVTRPYDGNDGVCDSECTLREAINAAGSGDTIEFSPLFDSPQTITLSPAAGFQTLNIDKSITIKGKGANLLTVRRNPTVSAPFAIFLTQGENVTISGMTISGGRTGGSFGFGGGVFNANNSRLNLDAVHITGNTVLRTDSMGGGIANRGTLYLSNSTVSGNRIESEMEAGGAGGIMAAGQLTVITNSTVTGNTATGFNGGVTDWNAGGIYINGQTIIRNSTISGNSATGSNSVAGIAAWQTTTIGSTIVASNVGPSPTAVDVMGDSFVSEGYNLIGNRGSITAFNHANDITGTTANPRDPQLGLLSMQGGSTPTIQPQTGSLAINRGSSFGLVRDQRGALRPADDPGIPNPADGADIGAFERQSAATNQAPIATSNQYSTRTNVSLTLNAPGVLANDHDVDSATITALVENAPAHGTLALNPNGSFNYVPGTGYYGTDTFTYRASDGATISGPAEVTITVLNGTPTATNDTYTVRKNVRLDIAAPGVLANDTDDEGDTLRAVLRSFTPYFGTLTLNQNGSFSITPRPGYTGPITFTYDAVDTAGAYSTATVTLDVVNDAPVAVNDAYTTSYQVPLSVPAPGVRGNDSDPNGDAILSSLVTDPIHGSAVLNSNGSFVYTPEAGFAGMDSFTYKVNDGTIDSNTATVTLNVTPVPPVANPDAYSVGKNQRLGVSSMGILGNDSDPNDRPLTAHLVSPPQHGTVTVGTDGSFEYDPESNYSGVDSFTYRANNGLANSNVATVSLTISPNSTWVVTKTADTFDNVCDTDCSLREAFSAASDGATIRFSSLFYSPQTISLIPGEGFGGLAADRELRIEGPGADLLTIEGNGSDEESYSLFNMRGPTALVTLSHLKLAGNNSPAVVVREASKVWLSNCIITGFDAGISGALFVDHESTLDINESTISNNTSLGSAAGAIRNHGTLIITNSTISGNRNLSADAVDATAGIWTEGSVLITNSTITQNTVAGTGAGGILKAVDSPGVVTVGNSIIAGNGSNPANPDVAGEFESTGYNIIGNRGSVTAFTATGDQAGTPAAIIDARLAPLGNYGGYTPTHALLSNSPAIDSGLTHLGGDQRGVERNYGDASDIGAFERTFNFLNSPLGPGGQGSLPSASRGQSYSVFMNIEWVEQHYDRAGETRPRTEGSPSATFEIIGGALPAGITLDPSTGELSGTPTVSGTFNFIVKATENDIGYAGAQQYALHVVGATAARVNISGRLLTPDGAGLLNARVTLTDQAGNTRTVNSSSFGHYSFGNVEIGRTYFITVSSKRYQFSPRVVTVTSEIEKLDLTANP